MEALQRRVLAVPHQILRYFDMVKRSRCSSHPGPYLDTRPFPSWEIENFQTSHVLVVWASVFKHGMMWCSLISRTALLVRRCGNERITHNETCILACDGLWFGFFHQLLGMMIIPFPFNYNTVEMGWNHPPTRFTIIPFNSTIPLSVSSRELVMSDEWWVMNLSALHRWLRMQMRSSAWILWLAKAASWSLADSWKVMVVMGQWPVMFWDFKSAISR